MHNTIIRTIKENNLTNEEGVSMYFSYYARKEYTEQVIILLIASVLVWEVIKLFNGYD